MNAFTELRWFHLVPQYEPEICCDLITVKWGAMSPDLLIGTPPYVFPKCPIMIKWEDTSLLMAGGRSYRRTLLWNKWNRVKHVVYKCVIPFHFLILAFTMSVSSYGSTNQLPLISKVPSHGCSFQFDSHLPDWSILKHYMDPGNWHQPERKGGDGGDKMSASVCLFGFFL